MMLKSKAIACSCLRCFLLMVFLSLPFNAYASMGTGISEEPYLVFTEEDLINISQEPGAIYKLMCDITLAEEWVPILEFSGTIDGNGYCIYNYKPSNYKEYTTAISALVSVNNGVIKNLGVYASETVIHTESTKVGIFAATNNGTIENCYFIGDINASFYIENFGSPIYSGGIVAINNGDIIGCYTVGNISSINRGHNDAFCGGICGLNEGNISKCSSNGEIYSGSGASSAGDAYSGGIVGYSSGNIVECCSAGKVTAHSYDHDSYSGGLIGYIEAGYICSNCYSHADVFATSYRGGEYGGTSLGGLIGYSNGIVDCCYATGNVMEYRYNNDFRGGLIGEVGSNSRAQTKNSFYCNDCPSNGLGSKCSEEELKNISTYNEWDFSETWDMNNSYPYLCEQSLHNKNTFMIFDVCAEKESSKVAVKLDAEEEINQDYLLVIAIYDEDFSLNKVVSTIIDPSHIENVINVETEYSFGDDKTIKVFIWDNFLNIRPFSNVYTNQCK